MFSPIFKGQLLRLAPPTADDQAIFASWTHDERYDLLLYGILRDEFLEANT